MSKVYSDVYLRELWNLWVLTQPDQSYKVVYANFDEMCRHVPSGPRQWLALIEKKIEFYPKKPMQLSRSLATNDLEIRQGSMESLVCEGYVEDLAARIEESSFATTAVEMFFNKKYENVQCRNKYIFSMLDDIKLVSSRSLTGFMEFADLSYRDCVAFMSRMLGEENIDVAKYLANSTREEEGMIAALAVGVMRYVVDNMFLPQEGKYYDDVIAKGALELFKDPEWAKKLVTEWVGKIREEGR
jgi:hypothetical protein